MRRHAVAALSAAILGFAIPVAEAAPVLTIYTNRAAWEAAVSGFSEENLNSFVVNQSYETSPVDVGDFTVSVAGDTFGFVWHNVGPDLTGNNVNGTPQINAATGATGGTTLAFDFPIQAFGANWQGTSDLGRVTSIDVDGTIVPIPNLNGEFWGFTSDTPFSSEFLFLTAGGPDGFGMDNVVYSPAVVAPEPATLGLLGLGLLGLGMRRRKTAR